MSYLPRQPQTAHPLVPQTHFRLSVRLLNSEHSVQPDSQNHSPATGKVAAEMRLATRMLALARLARNLGASGRRTLLGNNISTIYGVHKVIGLGVPSSHPRAPRSS